MSRPEKSVAAPLGKRCARPFRARACCLALLLLAGSQTPVASGQEARPAEDQSADLPRYTVELIVFAYADGASGASEIFVPELPRAPAEQPVRVYGDVPSGRAAGARVDAPPTSPPDPDSADTADREISGLDEDLTDIPLRARIELHRLPPEAYTLDAVYEKLVELDAYRPIMRAAWTQTTPPREASPAIRLRALGEPPPGLDGTVTLYQGRFVHLGIDLALDPRAAGGLPADGVPAAAGGDDPRLSATDRAIAGSGLAVPGGEGPYPAEAPWGDTDGLVVPPVRYRISEVRIIRDGELRYYDHPRFGVVAKLTKVREETPERDDARSAFAGD